MSFPLLTYFWLIMLTCSVHTVSMRQLSRLILSSLPWVLFRSPKLYGHSRSMPVWTPTEYHSQASLIDPDSFEYVATPSQKLHWENCTGTPFDAGRYEKEVNRIAITCSSCESDFDVPWQDEGSGYGERGFSCICCSCKSTITHDSLCVAIFMKEVKAVAESENAIIS